MNSKISVIVPMYGVEQFVGKCIESIMNQTYPRLEIILVDDGSPDRCGEIADQYALKDARIKVIHKENGGLSDGRNVGIEISTGDYLTFVDSDDFIHPQMCEALLWAAGDGDKAVSICGFQYVYEGKEHSIETYQKFGDVKDIDGKEIQKVYLHQTGERLTFTTAWGKMYKRDCFEEIRYPKGKLHEDEYTTFQLLYEANKIGYLDLPLYFYLTRESSIMGDFKAKRFDVFGGYEKRILYYMNYGEYEYAKATFFLGLHMLAQYRAWMNLKNEDCRLRLEENYQLMKELYHCYGGKWNLTSKEKLESSLFQKSFHLYFHLWRCVR